MVSGADSSQAAKVYCGYLAGQHQLLLCLTSTESKRFWDCVIQLPTVILTGCCSVVRCRWAPTKLMFDSCQASDTDCKSLLKLQWEDGATAGIGLLIHVGRLERGEVSTEAYLKEVGGETIGALRAAVPCLCSSGCTALYTSLPNFFITTVLCFQLRANCRS